MFLSAVTGRYSRVMIDCFAGETRSTRFALALFRAFAAVSASEYPGVGFARAKLPCRENRIKTGCEMRRTRVSSVETASFQARLQLEIGEFGNPDGLSPLILSIGLSLLMSSLSINWQLTSIVFRSLVSSSRNALREHGN